LKHNTLPHVIVSTMPISMLIEESNAISLSKIQNDLKKIKKKTHLQKRPQLSIEYIAPENATEKKLSEIWQEILGVEKIGIHDNFSELGGHSLLLAELYSKINEHYPDYFGMQDLFNHQTISSLSNIIIEKTTPIVDDENIVVNRIKF
jgi:polyketide synthase PksJ